MKMNLSKDVKILRVANAAAAGTSEVVSAVVDMLGFQSVCFVAMLGDVTDTSVLTLTVKTNSANHVSTPAPVVTEAKATFTAGPTNADNKMLAVDVHSPRQRYAFASLTRATANAVVDGIIAILYNGNEMPMALDAGIIAGSFTNDPDPA